MSRCIFISIILLLCLLYGLICWPCDAAASSLGDDVCFSSSSIQMICWPCDNTSSVGEDVCSSWSLIQMPWTSQASQFPVTPCLSIRSNVRTRCSSYNSSTRICAMRFDPLFAPLASSIYPPLILFVIELAWVGKDFFTLAISTYKRAVNVVQGWNTCKCARAKMAEWNDEL